ncbi:MAG: WG repeat-containing protein [Firmicutes bacterium]|nr:WG repeat-containing protein [Bacillota bacterium]
MNQTRMAVCIFLIAILLIGWGSVLTTTDDSAEISQAAVEQAQIYREKELYEMAILSCQEALDASPSLENYQLLVEIYGEYYQSVLTSSVLRSYQSALSEAANAWPSEASFWETSAALYLEKGEYTSAYSVVTKAAGKGCTSETLDALGLRAYYAFDSGYMKAQSLSLLGYEGSFTAYNGEAWGVISGTSTILSYLYTDASDIGPDGKLTVTDSEGVIWLVDLDGMKWARFDSEISAYGIYGDGFLPVQTGEGTWTYLDEQETLLPGRYLTAGTFSDGTAAVQYTDGTWGIIDTAGEPDSDQTWEEIRLNPDGTYLTNSRFLAKTGETWQIWKQSGAVVEDFSCTDVDVYLGEDIAYYDGSAWGFVDRTGDVTIEPCYEDAKSFSDGVAAVCKDGLWGFINTDGVLVIDYYFYDVGYFSDGACAVQAEEDGTWCVITWEVSR